jgi:hypothetical protein
MKPPKPPTIRTLKYIKDGKRYRSAQVTWYGADGVRQRKQFADQSEAALFASETHTRLLNNGAAHRNISTILPETTIREFELCFSRLGKYTITEATDFFLENFQDPDFKITIGDAAVKFRGAKEGVIRDRSIGQLKSTIGRFERYAGNCDIHEVTTSMVEKFLESLRAKDGVQKASRKTWNNCRADLHSFFEWCKSKPQAYVMINAATDIKRFKIDRGTVDILTAKQFEELLRYVSEFKDGRLVRFFALALFAGIRPDGELNKLASKRTAIDLDNGVIKLSAPMSKTGKERQVQIQPNLHQWLSKYDGAIFPPNHDRDIPEIRKRFGLTHDILRHTFVTMHIMAFDSFAQTAIQSGNSETIIRKHYLNVATNADAKRFWEIVPIG